MTHRNDSVFLRQMRDYAQHGISFAHDRNRRHLEADRQLRFALVQTVKLVSRAARQVSQRTQDAHPQIPWATVTGMSSGVASDYDQVNVDRLWDTVTNDLPLLLKELEKILPDE